MTVNTRQLARDARSDMQGGLDAIMRRQRARLAELVAYARAHSPYYREFLGDLPAEVDDPSLLPVTSKKLLMSHFDDWATDSEVTRERVEEFVADPARVGEQFLGKYLVATSSGTSGVRGLFVLDEQNLSIDGVLASRAGGGLHARDILHMITNGGRTAVVTAPGGHFYTVATTARFQLDHPRLRQRMRVFSIRQPLPELVDELNRFKPAILSGFAGMLTVLAGEQAAGRLHIRPALVIPGGETLTPEVRERLATVFEAQVRAAYACTECGYLGLGCEYGWYHVNSDWAVVEPVDADYRPVPPGRQSHTVLISNLANQVQPFLRYDLGDSVMFRPDPCPCGNLLPALRVQGRSADLLTFPARNGLTVSMSPMVFGTLLDRIPGVAMFQIVQTAPGVLRVRLRIADGADPGQVWRTVFADLAQLLGEHGAGDVTLERSDEDPQQEPGGKFRRVVPLARP
ncbi:hypothetical protein AB0L65_40450 [Nonomuraea sp. NPDC052116]|uniref:hypothetical protein n=1 Tax=Nonomuraea sp. NPDC052116 TaxID=3155665 RepID=UPI00342799AB